MGWGLFFIPNWLVSRCIIYTQSLILLALCMELAYFTPICAFFCVHILHWLHEQQHLNWQGKSWYPHLFIWPWLCDTLVAIAVLRYFRPLSKLLYLSDWCHFVRKSRILGHLLLQWHTFYSLSPICLNSVDFWIGFFLSAWFCIFCEHYGKCCVMICVTEVVQAVNNRAFCVFLLVYKFHYFACMNCVELLSNSEVGL